MVKICPRAPIDAHGRSTQWVGAGNKNRQSFPLKSGVGEGRTLHVNAHVPVLDHPVCVCVTRHVATSPLASPPLASRFASLFASKLRMKI